MTKFTIEYNPYIQKITFRKNDTILNSKNRIGAKSKNRLQELLGDQLANWEGLFNEIENECNVHPYVNSTGISHLQKESRAASGSFRFLCDGDGDADQRY